MNAILLSLLLIGQPQSPTLPQAPPLKQAPMIPQAPPVRPDVTQEVVYCKMQPRKDIDWSLWSVRQDDTLGKPGIYLSFTDGSQYRFEPDVDRYDLRAWILARKAVKPMQTPFEKVQPPLDPRSVPREVKDADGKSGAASLQYHAGHRCPQCGTSQTIVSGAGPIAGSHTHRCPRCNTEWFH